MWEYLIVYGVLLIHWTRKVYCSMETKESRGEWEKARCHREMAGIMTVTPSGSLEIGI